MKTDRGVSVTLSYVILLGVATTMLIAAFTVVSGMVDSQMNHAVQDELTVIGQSLSGDIERADRLYRSTDDNASTIELESRLPSHVSGKTYRVVVNGTSQELTLRTITPDTAITVPINATSLATANRSLTGGPIEIVLENDALEVREA